MLRQGQEEAVAELAGAIAETEPRPVERELDRLKSFVDHSREEERHAYQYLVTIARRGGGRGS